MEGLAELLPWQAVGTTGLVVLTVLLILTGKLIPATQAAKAMAALERENLRLQEEAREWRHAYRTVEEAQQISSRQLEEMLEYARATDAVLRALQDLREAGPPS